MSKRYKKNIILISALILLTSACTEGTFKITDPATQVIAEIHINTLWSDVEIDDFSCTVNKDGSKTFTFGNLNNNTSNGQASFNKMIPSLMEGLVKGAAQGITGIK